MFARLRCWSQSLFVAAGQLLTTRAARSLGRGLLCGGLLVCLWQPTLGSGAEAAASSVMNGLAMACGLIAGCLLVRGQGWRTGPGWLILAVAAVAMPLWCLAWLRGLQFWSLESSAFHLWCAAITLATTCLPALLWSAQIHAAQLTNRDAGKAFWSGVILGLAISVFGFVPLCGLQVLATLIAIGCAACSWFDWSQSLGLDEADERGQSRTIAAILEFQTIKQFGIATVCGVLGTLVSRELLSMMPAGVHGDYALCLGWLGGWGLGLTAWSGPGGNVRWTTWMLALWGMLILCSGNSLLEAHLWMNAHCSWPGVVILFRATLLISAILPVGMVLAGAVAATQGTADPRGAESARRMLKSIAVLIGGVCLGFCIATNGLIPLCGLELGLAIVAWSAGVMSLIGAGWSAWCVRRAQRRLKAGLKASPTAETIIQPIPGSLQKPHPWAFGRRSETVFSLGLIVTLMANFTATWVTPPQIAKLLFNSQSFFAYRNGLPLKKIPYVDDARRLATLQTSDATWTLWQQRTTDLQLRQTGVLRTTFSADSRITPQTAAEIVPAVLALALVDRPESVLLLGGLNLASVATCTAFPLERIDCCERHSAPLQLCRAELVRRNGYDPLTDERVHCRTIAPELAVMSAWPRKYDVICSTPAQSSLREAVAQCTAEFYQAAAGHLAEQGVFCQRFTAVDYGPEPLRVAAASMATAFRETALVEIGIGEYALLGTNSSAGLMTVGFIERLQRPHVRQVLAEANWDWSVILNLPAYDHAALREFISDTHPHANTVADGRFPFWTPREVMSWTPKLAQAQMALSKLRKSEPVYTPPLPPGEDPLPAAKLAARKAATNVVAVATDDSPSRSRRSRFLEWIGDDGQDPDLLRRLGEVSTQYQLVQDHPDAYWWEYRKTLKTQLQTTPRSLIRPVSGNSSEDCLHPEYSRRRDFLAALGSAKTEELPSALSLRDLADYARPYDPLISPYVAYEVAELHARRKAAGAADEIDCRLGGIFHAPAFDASVADLLDALKLLADQPNATGSAEQNWDRLNSLLTTLYYRSLNRSQRPLKSARLEYRVSSDVVKAIEVALAQMDELAPAASIPADEWKLRREVLEETLLKSLRIQRDRLQFTIRDSDARSQLLRQKLQSP